MFRFGIGRPMTYMEVFEVSPQSDGVHNHGVGLKQITSEKKWIKNFRYCSDRVQIDGEGTSL